MIVYAAERRSRCRDEVVRSADFGSTNYPAGSLFTLVGAALGRAMPAAPESKR